MTAELRHDLLAALGVAHGFGVRGALPPEDLHRPRQVHGTAVATLAPGDGADLGEADAVVSRLPGAPIGVVTADCVPVLVASADGRAVAAVHAGWRGLADGVIPEALRALRGIAGDARLFAVVGPHIGPCCYEVDEPVLDALRRHHAASLPEATRNTRTGHALLDLGRLASASLRAAGVAADAVGRVEEACTRCDAARFHSYRRDGERAGRLVHWIAAGP